MGLAAALSAAPALAQERCRSDLLPTPSTAARPRDVTPLDLARLRDFGRQDVALDGEPPFSVSPDGRLAALVLRRGDPSSDGYCLGVAVVPLDRSAPPRLVDVGGEFILNLYDLRGIPDLPIGNAEPVTPAWSPDGRRLAYLRRDGGLTRVWVALADGSGARPVTKLAVDARGVRWSADGRSLIVRSRPGTIEGAAAVSAEERSGFLYDRRFWTLSHSRPSPRLPIDEVEERIDPADGRVVAAATAKAAAAASRPDGAIAFAASPSGARAWTAPDDRNVELGPAALRVEIRGRTIICRSRFCADGVGLLWWKGDELFFLQGGSPENGGTTSLLRWRPEHAAEPSLILSTADALIGCQPVGVSVVCARETATQPRHLVSIDPGTARIRTIFDPNPEFGALTKGHVRRLRWRDSDGVAAYGDLVLPKRRPAGKRLPLIVVQYYSRGFLRGGTGDEYPIYPMAARGFAVLSVNRPRFFAAGKAHGFEQFMRMSTADFAERRRVLKSLETGVRKVIAGGWADPRRIGITGLSDGVATVQFALVNSNLFRAAAISSCCDGAASSMFAADRGYGDLLMAAGFPRPGDPDYGFWSRYSLAANARWLRTPILMQLSADEFRLALETFVTLDVHRVPVEMYVFAGDYHQKWHPAHRLAVYERAIDWFDFWLNGRADGDPAKTAQYDRWRELARRQRTAG